MGASQSTDKLESNTSQSKVITILNVDRCKKVGCFDRALFNEPYCERHLRKKQSCCGKYYRCSNG